MMHVDNGTLKCSVNTLMCFEKKERKRHHRVLGYEGNVVTVEGSIMHELKAKPRYYI